MSNLILFLIFVELGLIIFMIYYSFFVPEMERRRAFRRLTADEIEELKNTMTADHFFRLQANSELPKLKIKRKKTAAE